MSRLMRSGVLPRGCERRRRRTPWLLSICKSFVLRTESVKCEPQIDIQYYDITEYLMTALVLTYLWH